MTRPTFIPLLAPAGNDGHDPSALREAYCGDLTIVYTFGPQFGRRIVTHIDLDQLGLSPRLLRRSALDHLEVLASRAQFHGQPPALMLSFEGLESSLLLANDLWGRLQGSVPGELVVGVPARDVVIITGSQSTAGMEKVRRAVDRVFFAGDEHLLTRTLLVRRANAWEPFDPATRLAARPARPLAHHRGPDQQPRQYQEHPSWPSARVPVASPISLTPAAGMTGFNIPVASPVPPRPVFTGMMPAVGPNGMPPPTAPPGYLPPPSHSAMPGYGAAAGPSLPQRGTASHAAAAHAEAQFGDTSSYPATPYSAVPCSAIPYSAMPNSAMQGPVSPMPAVVYPAQSRPESRNAHAAGVNPPYQTGTTPALSQTGYHPVVQPAVPQRHLPMYPPSSPTQPSWNSANATSAYHGAGYQDAGYQGGAHRDDYADRAEPYRAEPEPAPDQSYPRAWGPAPEPVSRAVRESRSGPRARFTR